MTRDADRPTMGLKHPTVVPTNYRPSSDEGDEAATGGSGAEGDRADPAAGSSPADAAEHA